MIGWKQGEVLIRVTFCGCKEGRNGIVVGCWPCGCSVLPLLVSLGTNLSFVKLDCRGVERR